MEEIKRFFKPCGHHGSMECVHYTTRAYALEKFYGEASIPLEKTMYVYLPWRYDPSEKYNVLYLMHGGTDDEGYWFGTGRYDGTDTKRYTEYGNVTQNLVDNMTEAGLMEPTIIVTPGFNEDIVQYQKKPDYADAYFETVHTFWKQMKDDIMPYIQQHYSTYADGLEEDDFIRARSHHAYAGVSQGSVTGFHSVLLHLADRFSYVGNFSAGAVRIEGENHRVVTDEMKLAEIAEALKKSPELFYWYNGCGNDDVMYETHRKTYEYLLSACPDQLNAGKDGNCCFHTEPGGTHHYRFWIADLYRCLRRFFQ